MKSVSRTPAVASFPHEHVAAEMYAVFGRSFSSGEMHSESSHTVRIHPCQSETYLPAKKSNSEAADLPSRHHTTACVNLRAIYLYPAKQFESSPLTYLPIAPFCDLPLELQRTMEISKSWLSSLVFVGVLLGLVTSSGAYVFYVGGRDGWVSNPSESYDNWAGRNRFQVNDTLGMYSRFGSSVLLVVPMFRIH